MKYSIKPITEETPVAWDKEGQPILAERLQRWAYNQLAAAPDMYYALKTLEKWYQSHRGELPKQARQALAKAEGKEEA